MPTLHRDVELTYVADEAFELPALTRFLSGDNGGAPAPTRAPLSEGDVAEHRLEATYFDTEDLRLAAAGLTLRRRTGGDDAGWHLKVPAGTDTRSEVRLPPGRVPPGRTPAVPAELQNMVWAHTLGAPLLPTARISTLRSVRRLTDPTGQVLVELADDRVTGRRLLPQNGTGAAAGAPTSWREIEVEFTDGDGSLRDLVDAGLRARGLRTAPTASELARILGADDGDGQAPADGARLTVKSTAGEVVLAHIRQQVAQVRAQDLPVRLDAPDSVHKMRVATRRLRSALRTFKPLFDADVVRPLRAELKWLAGELGAARDAEVMRDRVRAAVAEQSHDAGVRAGADDTQAELSAAYRTAHDRVLSELDGDRYHRILTMLHALAEHPPFRKKKAQAPAGKVVPRLVARSYQQLAALVQDAQSRPAGPERDELLHEARKVAKQTRYAGETVAPAFGKDATAFAQAMEAVQEALGEHQDSVLTRKRLRDLARQASSTEVAFLYGRLHAQEEARAEQSQQHFEAAWTAAGHKTFHRWLR